MNDTCSNRSIWLLGFLLSLFYWFLSSHIDFHPDEAIYFDAIPVSLRNDSGLFYSTFYLLVTHWLHGLEGARMASAILAGGTFVAVARSIRLLQAPSALPALILFLTFAASYQAMFVFIRVRPEAAWWFCAALIIYSIVRFEVGFSTWNGALIAAIMILPMNHRLSWFACAFLAGYALLFLLREKGWRTAGLVWLALLTGVLVNILLRTWWVGASLEEAFAVALGSSVGQRQPFSEFVKLVFYGAPLFLNDMAQNPNLYEQIAGSRPQWLSHAFMQNALWAIMVVLPFIGRSWKERYVFSFPLFAFFAFWLSGYYNPTYSAGLSLYCLMVLAYSWPNQKCWKLYLIFSLLLFSIINGLSFIGTRILNHGEANFFASEKTIRQIALQMENGQKIALPERYTPAISGLDLQSYVNFKQDIPVDVDVLIIDSYDSLMYGFVPDFEMKKQSLAQQAERMCLYNSQFTPVYQNDTVFSGDRSKLLQTSGSWFFRNSSAYTLSIYKQCVAQNGN